MKWGHGHLSQPLEPALLTHCSARARTRGQGAAGWGRSCSRRGERFHKSVLAARGGCCCCWQEEGFGGNTPRCHAQLPSVTIQQHFCPKSSPVPAGSADAGTRSQGKALQGFLARRKKSEGSKVPASPRNSPASLLPQAPSSSRGCCRFRWVRNGTAEGETNRRERKKLEAEGYSREIIAIKQLLGGTGGGFCSTGSLSYITAPGSCLVAYRIFILG